MSEHENVSHGDDKLVTLRQYHSIYKNEPIIPTNPKNFPVKHQSYALINLLIITLSKLESSIIDILPSYG